MDANGARRPSERDARRANPRAMAFVLAYGAREIVVPSEGAGVVVGRHRDCALRAGSDGDATTSRRHAEFRTRADACEARDLGSAHGTRFAQRDGVVVEVTSTWTRVCGRDDGERVVTLGKGATEITVRFRFEDDGSETERDDDDESETEDAAPKTMVMDDGEMARSDRRRGQTETLGEAETVTIGVGRTRRDADGNASRRDVDDGGENFKRFKKQYVVGLFEKSDSPKKKKAISPRRRAPEPCANVYEHTAEEIERLRAEREAEVDAEVEADKLFEIGLPSSKKQVPAKRKTPAKRK